MKIIRNFGYNLFYQLLALALPLITIPYISRVLGPSGVGEYAFTSATTQYFILFGLIGIRTYGSRTIAQISHKTEEVKKTFWNLYVLQLCFSFSSYLLYTIIFSTQFDQSLYFAQSFLVLAIVFDISWLFIGLENFKKIVIRDAIVKLAGLVAIFTFVKTSDDLVVYALILSLSIFLGQLSMWISIGTIVGKPQINIKQVQSHLKPTLLLFIPQIAISIYAVLDRTMLGLFSSIDDVAIYDQAQKIIKVSLAIVPALSTVMMPRIANMIAKKETENIEKYMAKSGLFIWIISCGLSFGLAGIASEFVPWFYGEEFLAVTNVFYVSVWMVIAVGGANLFAVQYLIPSNQQNKYTVSVTVAAIINIILNIVLIPKFGFYGAAFATVVAEFIGVGIQINYVRKQLNVWKLLKPLPKIFISAMIMFVVLRVIGNAMGPGILTTIIQVIVGGSSYLIMLWLSKSITKSDLKL